MSFLPRSSPRLSSQNSAGLSAVEKASQLKDRRDNGSPGVVLNVSQVKLPDLNGTDFAELERYSSEDGLEVDKALGWNTWMVRREGGQVVHIRPSGDTSGKLIAWYEAPLKSAAKLKEEGSIMTLGDFTVSKHEGKVVGLMREKTREVIRFQHPFDMAEDLPGPPHVFTSSPSVPVVGGKPARKRPLKTAPQVRAAKLIKPFATPAPLSGASDSEREAGASELTPVKQVAMGTTVSMTRTDAYSESSPDPAAKPPRQMGGRQLAARTSMLPGDNLVAKEDYSTREGPELQRLMVQRMDSIHSLLADFLSRHQGSVQLGGSEPQDDARHQKVEALPSTMGKLKEFCAQRGYWLTDTEQESFAARLFNKSTYEEAVDDHPARAPATLEKIKQDLRNTVKPAAVKRCKKAILQHFTGKGLPLEKVPKGKSFVGKLKANRASWAIDGKFRRRGEDGIVGSDPYESKLFRAAAADSASAQLNGAFEDIKAGDLAIFEYLLQRALDGDKPWDLETRGGALQRDMDAARELQTAIEGRRSKYVARFKHGALPTSFD